jgi:hypothetical protein
VGAQRAADRDGSDSADASAADLINSSADRGDPSFEERAILLNQASNAQMPAFCGGVRVRRCQRSVDTTVVGGRK